MTRISDSRESPDSRESCESIRANHATKELTMGPSSRKIFQGKIPAESSLGSIKL